MPPEQAADHAARFREHDNNLLRAQHLVYDDDVAMRQTSHESRVDLMQLFAADSSGSDEPAQGTVPQSQECAIFCRTGGRRELLLSPPRSPGGGHVHQHDASAAAANCTPCGMLREREG